LGADQPQSAYVLVVAEQLLAAADDKRVHEQRVGVNQVRGRQVVHELTAAQHGDVAVALIL
jgi:hypothetical protein